MWKEIDDIIRHRRDELDREEPGDAVWDAIRDRMDRPEQGTVPLRAFHRRPVYRAAAAVLVLAGAIGLLLGPLSGPAAAGNRSVDWDGLAPGLREAEAHFASSSGRLEREVRDLLPEDGTADRATIFLDDLATAYDELKEDALRTGVTEEVVHAMIANYRLRIHLLEKLLEDLRRARDQGLQPAFEESPDAPSGSTHQESI